MSNIETVQNMYAAFGQGDIPAILACLAADVEWEYGMADSGVPWFQRRKGRAEVPKFFEALAAVDFKQFQPKTFLESGNIVVSLIDVAFIVRATGQKVAEEDEVHIWHFNDEGHVTKFCHKADTHQHWMALQNR